MLCGDASGSFKERIERNVKCPARPRPSCGTDIFTEEQAAMSRDVHDPGQQRWNVDWHYVCVGEIACHASDSPHGNALLIAEASRKPDDAPVGSACGAAVLALFEPRQSRSPR